MGKEVKQDTRTQRELYQFLVDGAKPDMKPIIKQLNRWRSHRKLTGWILDMFRLWEDLKQGNTKVLLELFPQFAELLQDNTAVLTEIRELRQEFKNFNIAPVQMQPVHPGGLKPLAGAHPIAMPTFNDDDDQVTVRVDVNAAANTTDSFLDAMLKLQ